MQGRKAGIGYTPRTVVRSTLDCGSLQPQRPDTSPKAIQISFIGMGLSKFLVRSRAAPPSDRKSFTGSITSSAVRSSGKTNPQSFFGT